MNLVNFILLAVLLALPAFAEEPSEMINKVTCTKGKDSRELEIVAKGTGHVATYTRDGKATEVATCSLTKEKCQAVFDQIRVNLEKTDFDCKT